MPPPRPCGAGVRWMRSIVAARGGARRKGLAAGKKRATCRRARRRKCSRYRRLWKRWGWDSVGFGPPCGAPAALPPRLGPRTPSRQREGVMAACRRAGSRVFLSYGAVRGPRLAELFPADRGFSPILPAPRAEFSPPCAAGGAGGRGPPMAGADLSRHGRESFLAKTNPPRARRPDARRMPSPAGAVQPFPAPPPRPWLARSCRPWPPLPPPRPTLSSGLRRVELTRSSLRTPRTPSTSQASSVA